MERNERGHGGQRERTTLVAPPAGRYDTGVHRKSHVNHDADDDDGDDPNTQSSSTRMLAPLAPSVRQRQREIKREKKRRIHRMDRWVDRSQTEAVALCPPFTP